MKINLIQFSSNLHNLLLEYGIEFNKYGYPIFPKEFILMDNPEEILPYHHRNAAKDKKKTVISFYEEDEKLYRCLKKLDFVAEECSKYMGIIGFDLSPCIHWNIQQQKFNLLLSQLVTIYLAIHGNKVIPNFRIGVLETLPVLLSYPQNPRFCVGSLGCSRKISDFNFNQFRTKVIYSRPKELLYYGRLLKPYKDFLKDMDIPYKVYMDFRTRSFMNKGAKLK